MDTLNGDFRPVQDADAQVAALLAMHHAAMRATGPEQSCHVMTAQALRAAGAHVFALWDGDGEIRAVGALKPLRPGAAPEPLAGFGPVVELKSMHVAAAHRGQGFGHALLSRLLTAARDMGARGACLETGASDPFAATRRLYGTQGFRICPPFADYHPDPLSVFMYRVLQAPA